MRTSCATTLPLRLRITKRPRARMKRDGNPPALWAEVQNLLGIAHLGARHPGRGNQPKSIWPKGTVRVQVGAGGLYEERPATSTGR